MKHGKYAVIETVGKGKGGSKRVNERGSSRKDIHVKK